MAEILNKEIYDPDGHNCRDELPYGRANLHPRREELEWNIVARCSCGRIWNTKSYGWSYTEWRPARWWVKWYYAFRKN